MTIDLLDIPIHIAFYSRIYTRSGLLGYFIVTASCAAMTSIDISEGNVLGDMAAAERHSPTFLWWLTTGECHTRISFSNSSLLLIDLKLAARRPVLAYLQAVPWPDAPVWLRRSGSRARFISTFLLDQAGDLAVSLAGRWRAGHSKLETRRKGPRGGSI